MTNAMHGLQTILEISKAIVISCDIELGNNATIPDTVKSIEIDVKGIDEVLLKRLRECHINSVRTCDKFLGTETILKRYQRKAIRNA